MTVLPLSEGARSLYLAVLADAFARLAGANPEAVGEGERRSHVAVARKWLYGAPAAVDAESCCLALGLDVSAVRRRVRSGGKIDVRALYARKAELCR